MTTVAQLIEKLQSLPNQDAEVKVFRYYIRNWDSLSGWVDIDLDDYSNNFEDLGVLSILERINELQS